MKGRISVALSQNINKEKKLNNYNELSIQENWVTSQQFKKLSFKMKRHFLFPKLVYFNSFFVFKIKNVLLCSLKFRCFKSCYLSLHSIQFQKKNSFF